MLSMERRAQDAKGKSVKGDEPAEMERQLEVLKVCSHLLFSPHPHSI